MEKEKEYVFEFRQGVSSRLKGFCVFARDEDFIELTMWANSDGFDVYIDSCKEKMFGLTWGEFDALKKLAKQLDNPDNFKDIKS